MQVTFDINDFPDMVLAAREILDYAAGKTQSVELRAISGAISDLRRAERECEEVPEKKTSAIEHFKFLEPVC